MKNPERIIKILLQIIPIIIMLILIPLVANDYLLSLIFIVIVILNLFYKYEKRDLIFLFTGLIIMTLSEYLFIKTGVETFNRNTLFGIMPLWLPIIWAYAFVVIKRIINIIK